MKLFIKRLFIFFIPIFIGLLILEFSLNKIPNSYAVKNHFMQNYSGDIETLILGSSHTFYGLDPSYFTTNTFNAANISQSPALDLAILKTFEDDLVNLNTVVIRLSYDTLFEQLKNSSEDWRLKNYKIYTSIYFDYNIKHNFEIMSLGVKQGIKNFKAYYLDAIPQLNCDSLGWGNDLHKKHKLNLDEVGSIVAKKHTAKNWDLLATNELYYKQIMEWCSSHNINVILVTPPSYKSYYNNLDDNQLKKMIEIGKRLDRDYTNCSYFNFLRHTDFTSVHFYDGDHLNATGAQKFSTLIDGLIAN